MLPVLRMLFMVPLAIFTINLTVARAQILSEADFQATRAMLAAAQGGDWNRAYAELVPIGEPLPLKILHWMNYSRPGAPGRFPDIAEFIEKIPTGRGKGRCATMPKKPWQVNLTAWPLTGFTGSLRSARWAKSAAPRSC